MSEEDRSETNGRMDEQLRCIMIPRDGDVDTRNRVYQSAPDNCVNHGTSAVNGVWLSATEDVEWVWTHLPNGKSYVSGYNIRYKSLGDRK